MSFPERPCDTFRRTKIKDCNDIKALASDGGKCFLKFIKKYLHNYTYRVIIMQNYSKNIHDFHPHPGYCPRIAQTVTHPTNSRRMGDEPGIQNNL